MEILVQILILFILIGTSLKLSFVSWPQLAITAVVMAIFIVLAYPYAIQQSKTQLSHYLNDVTVMQNIAVIVTLDSAVMIAYAFMALRELFGKKVKPWIMVSLQWFPGLLVFPVLFYLLTQAVFSFSGVGFQTISYATAGLVLVVFPLASRGLKKLVPEMEMRYEIHFMVTIFVTILGLLTTVNGNVTYAAVEQPLDTKALFFAVALFLLLFILGYVWSKIRWKIGHRIPPRLNRKQG
jgi:hypothetical protein